MSNDIPDELQANLLYQGTDPRLLIRVATGELNARELAILELASRGLKPTTGAWIGFAEARDAAELLINKIREGQA